MTKLSVNEAKERLPELLEEGAKGEEIVITKGDGASYKGNYPFVGTKV